jgi:regulator of cell morphogenesis and NO signaling
MNLSEDYKNIVKLRFDVTSQLSDEFFKLFYEGIKSPKDFDISSFKALSLKEILEYLKKSHNEYLTLWFPKIENLIRELQQELGVNDVTLALQSFVVNYANELNNHINFEEKVLYNFVQKLINGVYIEKEKMFVLNHFLETHNHDVANELTTIQKVILNKSPELKDNKLIVELFEQMNIVQNDLEVHGIIEDDILIEKIHSFISENF